jgi:hypothetical protein
MLAFMHLALVSDTADIDRVRHNLVSVSSAEQTTAVRAPRAIDADRKTKAFRVQLLLETHYASRFEIAPKQ